MLGLGTERGFSATQIGHIGRGWGLAMQGQEEDGNQQIHQGMADAQAIGTELHRPYNLALLAEAYGKARQPEEGLTVIAEGLATAHKTGECYYEAELYRLKGELTLAQSSVQGLASSVPSTQHLAPSTQAEAEAEVCFHKAIEIARRQSAKSLELRAVMSLSRLWQQQGKQKDAHQMLAYI